MRPALTGQRAATGCAAHPITRPKAPPPSRPDRLDRMGGDTAKAHHGPTHTIRFTLPSTLATTCEAETERSLGSWRSCEATSSSSLPALSPRERYTAYFHDSGCVGCCDVESDDEEAEEDRDPEDDYGVYGPAEMDPFEWEVVRPLVPLMPATAAETGRYLSPRALSGSVVRLWDQGADRSFMTAAASRRRMGRAGTVSSF
ncbi:hypothetical protein TRIUR3_07874 [Triticum urartu]|uniref:Uncharacterized protein n=1 Tax=Triticum urartu TaxID=4572 RepID=M8AI43_TRIUA|nr:hypothetical protein TRIUR3_07874 [Triticum urartu]